MGHRVTLDAFSGLPNPQWRLSDQESRLFDAAIVGLERRDVPSRQAPGLGYRGFEVCDESKGVTARVYLTSVTHQSESGAVQLYDPEHRLEELLIESLRAKAPEDPRLAAVLAVIESKPVDPESNR